MLKKLIAENLYRWEKDQRAAPTQLSITPTNLCNLRCRSCWQRDQQFCANSHNKPAELSDQKLCDIIREASQLGVRCVELTGGGEPLARKITPELIQRIKSSGMIGWMTSNGTLLTEELIRHIVDVGWDKLTISLDGPNAQINDYLRPPAGSFEKIRSSLEAFRGHKKYRKTDKPDITFNVVVSRHNVNELEEMISLAASYDVRGVTFEPVKVLSESCNELLINFERDYEKVIKVLRVAQETAAKNNVFTNIDGLLSAPELIKYSGKLLNTDFAGPVQGSDGGLSGVPCIEPWFHIYLETDGNVRPCCVSPGFGENIKNKTLKEIWFGEKFSAFRNAILSRRYPSSCNQCNANLICFSREIQGILKEEFHNEKTEAAMTQPAADAAVKVPDRDGAERKLKVLVTDTAPLYPPLWGGPKRIWSLYANLDPALFDITYVGVSNSASDSRYRASRVRHNIHEILCQLPPHYYFFHLAESLFFKNNSLDLFTYLHMHTDWQFKHVLGSVNADVVICSHPWSSLSVKKQKNQVFIYDAHNCEYRLMERILGKHWLRGAVLEQVRKIEGDACRKSDLVLVCADKEKQDFLDLYKVDPAKILMTPNGTNIVPPKDEAARRSHREKLSLGIGERVIIFIGAYYKPNNDATKFILEKLASELPDFKFLIVGSVRDAFRDAKIPGNVQFLGQMSEEGLNTALGASDIAINPMFTGAGIHIKMLDYMSYGLPVVTTPVGARGIATNGRDAMVVCEPEMFAENIRRIFADKGSFDRLASEGRDLVAENYDWKRISGRVQDAILEKIGKTVQAVHP